jgi:HAAS
MTQSLDRLDRLVEDYLGAVSYACRDLPPERRDDLIGDLREHIAAARAVLYQPTEAAVRTILDRLGEPAAIAAEARLAEGLPPNAGVAQPVRGPSPAEPPNRWMSRPMPPALVAILAVLALFAITVMVLGYVMATREPMPPMR